MTFQPYYISSFENDSGLDQYYEPFLIPEKAFPTLEDAYCWRGRVRRRFGFKLLGRLRRVLVDLSESNTTGAGTYVVSDLLSTVRATEPNAEIQAGTVTITIDSGGGDQTVYNDATTPGILTFVSGTYTISSGKINYVTGAINLIFSVTPGAGLSVTVGLSYYPSLPVMGLPSYELPAINAEKLFAFDTKYAYQYTGTAWIEVPAVTPTTWNGTNYNFFFSTNYFQNSNGNLLWTTNFNVGSSPDPIRYYDSNDWTTFAPKLDAGGSTFLQQARIILPYKGRLVFLNTWEGATLVGSTNYQYRIRWSQQGTPLATDAFQSDITGKGGFLDVNTNEKLIGAAYVKDVLIVKFERSSWKLVYTNNQVKPFDIQKINAEFGAESTFSLVQFDRGVFGCGNVGITTDDSINVVRIDLKIPQIIFNFNNDNNGVERIYGIRDFANELVYWSFPTSSLNPTFPNRVLVYNYINSTYATFVDSWTCYGYYQQTSDKIWSDLPYLSWDEWEESWDSGNLQSAYPDVVAGNQQGYVEVLNQGVGNDAALSITSISNANPSVFTVINHNLESGAFVKIVNILGTGQSKSKHVKWNYWKSYTNRCEYFYIGTIDKWKISKRNFGSWWAIFGRWPTNYTAKFQCKNKALFTFL